MQVSGARCQEFRVQGIVRFVLFVSLVELVGGTIYEKKAKLVEKWNY